MAIRGWPRRLRCDGPLAIQRCTNHKLWNLLAKAPAHLREELAEDYRRMIYAPSREAVEQARVGFLRKWKLRCKAVGASFEEAGDELFTFTSFPSSQWKALRTTNALERINEEFRRRTKPRPRSPMKRRCCSCYSDSCAAGKSPCAASSAGSISLLYKWRRRKRLYSQLLARRWLMPTTFPPIDRHHQAHEGGSFVFTMRRGSATTVRSYLVHLPRF